MDENILLAELAAACTLPELDPLHEVTAQMLAEAAGIDRATARKKLEAKVKRGELLVHWAKGAGGTPEKAYYKGQK